MTGLKCLDMHRSKKNMNDQGVLLPKWFTHRGITLAKGQLGHTYTFWTMPILIFSSVANFGQQSLLPLSIVKTWKVFPLGTYRGFFLSHFNQFCGLFVMLEIPYQKIV